VVSLSLYACVVCGPRMTITVTSVQTTSQFSTAINDVTTVNDTTDVQLVSTMNTHGHHTVNY